MEIPDKAKTDIDFRITYLRSTRFVQFFKNYNINIETAVHLNEIFANNLATDIVPIKNAQEVIKELHKDYKIFVATNGPIKAAHTKVEKIGISKYITHIFCSEEIGFSKPFPEFFDYLFSKINTPREKAILIGDSLTNDVGSGMKNDFDTVWYNPNNQPLPDEYKPTIIINDLKELKRKLTT